MAPKGGLLQGRCEWSPNKNANDFCFAFDEALRSRLGAARRMRVRQTARGEGKWNVAMAGLAEQVAAADADDRLELQYELAQLCISAGQCERALELLVEDVRLAARVWCCEWCWVHDLLDGRPRRRRRRRVLVIRWLWEAGHVCLS